jgi:hypothetical protein
MKRPARFGRISHASERIRRRIGLSLFEPEHHVVVEPAEPGQLQELRPRHLEDEGRDAHADHLGERQRRHGAEPEAVRQHP